MLNDIVTIISCLCTLSVAMRQPVPQDRFPKYAEIDMSHYELFDNQYVLEKFPKANPLLIKRLGNANTQRRQYFKYRLLHHERIAKGLEGMGSVISVDKSTPPGLDVLDSDPVQGNDMSSRSATNQDTLTGTEGEVITAAKTSTTISNVPKSSVESDGGQTATSFGTIMEEAAGNSKVKLLKVPDPPDADRVFAGNAFQCPYCCTMIIVKNSKAWQYVLKSPYACRNRPELISSHNQTACLQRSATLRLHIRFVYEAKSSV